LNRGVDSARACAFKTRHITQPEILISPIAKSLIIYAMSMVVMKMSIVHPQRIKQMLGGIFAQALSRDPLYQLGHQRIPAVTVHVITTRFKIQMRLTGYYFQ